MMAPVLLREAPATQLHHAVLASKPGGPMHLDCLQTWRPLSIFWSRVTQTPAGRTPPKGHCSLCLALLPSSYVTFPTPVSTLGALSPVQAPALDNSTPCPDFCPGFCFCPASSLLPSCPQVFISLLTREQGAPSHPNPGIEVWQHPVGFNS